MSSQVSVTAAFKRCVLRKKNGCMCTQVSVTAAFKSCGKKEVRYLPTLTLRSCHETSLRVIAKHLLDYA